MSTEISETLCHHSAIWRRPPCVSDFWRPLTSASRYDTIGPRTAARNRPWNESWPIAIDEWLRRCTYTGHWTGNRTFQSGGVYCNIRRDRGLPCRSPSHSLKLLYTSRSHGAWRWVVVVVSGDWTTPRRGHPPRSPLAPRRFPAKPAVYGPTAKRIRS